MQREVEVGCCDNNDGRSWRDDQSGGLGPMEMGQASMHVYHNKVELLSLEHRNGLEVICRQQHALGPNGVLVFHLPTKLLEDRISCELIITRIERRR